MVNKSDDNPRILRTLSCDPLRALLDEAISEKRCTGVASAIVIDGKVAWTYCGGKTGGTLPAQREQQTPPSPETVTSRTQFDVASLTKPLSTALLTLKALQSGLLRLDDPVKKFLPDIHSRAGEIPLIALLTHTGGMPAIPALQQYFPNPAELDRNRALARLFSIEPEAPAGEHVLYSCTGYMLIGAILERISGMLVGDLFRQELAIPLRLPRASFAERILNSGEPAPLEHSVATESCSWRQKRMRGQVHDESAYCLSGHAGNAGLFLSLEDALILGKLILGEGSCGGKQIFKPEILQLLQEERTQGLEERRAIGFRLHDSGTADGPLWPAQAFGHTGFTGTSIFFEPQKKMLVILFTNRVYYGRDATANAIVALRKEFHSRVWRLFA